MRRRRADHRPLRRQLDELSACDQTRARRGRNRDSEMKIDLALGEQRLSVNVRVPDELITIARAKYTPAIKSWEQVVEDGLRDPIGAPVLRAHNLKGKKIALITDDWGRPTPSY